MGWAIKLVVRYKDDKTPVQRFIDVSLLMQKGLRFIEIIRLKVRSGDNKILVLDRESISEGNPPILLSEILALKAQFPGENLAIEGWWAVAERYTSKSPKKTPHPDPGRVLLTVYGRQYNRLQRDECDYQMSYEGNDYKGFYPSVRGQAAQWNVQAIVEEARMLAEAGADSIFGVDADSSCSPLDLYLLFSQNLDDYRQGLLESGVPKDKTRLLTESDTEDAVLQCEEISFMETSAGLILYHTDFVGGDLRNYFETLAKRINVEEG